MDNQILELRQQGLGYKLISKQLGITKAQVRYVCTKYGVNGFVKPAEKKTEDEVALLIRERLPSFEYAGNYSGHDSRVDIRCLRCGSVMARSMITIRNRNVRCRVCDQIEKEQQKIEQQKLKQFLEAERKRQRFLNKQFEQIEMKQCPICKAFFVGNRTYCSEHCRNQNKQNMKDGYRLLFPLQEVYDRDGGICYLCGKPCDWSDYKIKDGAIVCGNNYPSRDHVKPKSIGGLNDWDNIRLAHRICNSRKGIAPRSKK